MAKPIRVFISSTWEDLQPEREAVEKALHRMQDTAFAGMEYFGSRPETPKEVSLAKVDLSDVYIGIFAHRYGSGITEAEYRRAQKQGIPCLIYFKDDSVPVPPVHIEQEPARVAKLKALKRELKVHLVSTFKSPDHLATQVVADLHNLLGSAPAELAELEKAAKPLRYVVLSVVNREEELDRAREFIRNIEIKAADHLLLNFFALPGFGKTALLHRMWEIYERSLPASFVDIGSYLKEDDAFDLCRLLVDILRQLGERIPKRLASLPSEFGRSTNEMWLAEQLAALIRAATTYGKVVLLLLDDYDRMPAGPRSWFEANVLSPAIRTGQVAVILTSELELRFTERIDLRMRLESHELLSFTEQTIPQSFPRYKSIASETLRLTGGLPVLTMHLVQYLDDLGISTQAELRTHERELVKSFYRTYIDETVFRGLDQALLDTISVVALLRRFDIAVLRGLLPKVLPRYYKGSTKVDYFDLIDRLSNRIQWRKQGGYTLNQGLRILIEAYTLSQHPKLYERVNRSAVALYRKELDTTEYREHYLLELLYHRLALLKSEKETTPLVLQTALDKELQRYVGGESKTGPSRIEDLDSLRNCLLRDPDLKDYVSEDVLSMIQSQIDAQSEAKRVISLNAESR